MESHSKPMPPGVKKHIVAKTTDIAEGDRLLFEIDGRPIGVYRVDNRFYALLNRCPHLGGPLCQGQVVSEISSTRPGEIRFDSSKTYVTCPWHNWEFDIRTGQSYWNPKGLRARPFPVGIENGKSVDEALKEGRAERIEGPFKAETVQVDVEGDYVVISLRSVSPSPGSLASESTSANSDNRVAGQSA